MIGDDENIERLLMNRSFDSLIQRLARPATDIFLRFPRSKIQRIRIMQEFQMELLILNKYMINGRICERGIIQFLANGKLGDFQIEIQKNEIVVDVPSENDERKEIQNTAESKDVEQREDMNKMSKKTNKFKDAKEIPKESKRNFFGVLLNNSVYKQISMPLNSLSETQLYDSDENPEKITHLPKSNKKGSTEANCKEKESQSSTLLKPLKASETQFEKLKFSPEAEFLSEIQVEIQEDLSEFVNCMKNSVFYGSGINRFYNQELDKFRRKFIELEVNKNRWQYYVFKYIREKNPKVNIPAPSMSDELEVRTQKVVKINEINFILNSL
jgi:hypothetical protein